MLRRTLATLAVIALPLGLLAGCGDDSVDNPFEGKSSAEVKDVIIEAMSEVEAVRMSAKVTRGDDGPMSMVIVLDREGNCDGSIAIGGGKADVKGDSDWSYLRGDQDFWAASTGNQAQAAELMTILGDKWVRRPAADNADMCDLDSFLDDLSNDPDDDDKGFDVGDIEKVEGVESVKLVGLEPDEETGDTTTMWVAAEAPHRIVKVVLEGGDEPSEFKFSKYNEKVNVDVPADGEWIDLSSLG